MGVEFVKFSGPVHKTPSIPFLVLLDDSASASWRHPTVFGGVENRWDDLRRSSSLLDAEHIGRLVNVVFTLFEPAARLTPPGVRLILVFSALDRRLGHVRLDFNRLPGVIQSRRCRLVRHMVDQILLVCNLYSVHRWRNCLAMGVLNERLLIKWLELS